MIEKNLIKDIDVLQYEKNSLIEDYEKKIRELEEELLKFKTLQNNRIKLISGELLNEKIANHELKNKLKLLQDNLKCEFIKKISKSPY